MTPEELYTTVASRIADAIPSQMFGKPCFKLNGKAFVCFFQECMVFKLQGEPYHEAIQLPGAQRFDPSGKDRPMKEWVQVPVAHQQLWPRFAEAAAQYLLSA